MTDDEAIIENRLAALVRLVASMFALVGLVRGAPMVASLPREVRKQVRRMLQPCESALRRLIFMRARGLVVSLGPKRSAPMHPIRRGNGSGDRIPPFVLFDPRKWFQELAKTRRPLPGPGPRISSFDEPRPSFDCPAPRSAEMSPASLCKRLLALQNALETIPAQAKRLARLRARRKAAGEPLRRTEPIRPGPPPGYRKYRTHPVDEILSDCDALARREPRPPERA